MGLEKHYFQFLIIVVSLSQCCISSFHDDLQFDDDNYNYIEEEYGENFGAYPSYFNPLKGVKIYNSVKIVNETKFSDFNKLRSRSLAASSDKIVNVLDFGAKGDGNADDTEAFQKAWKEACSSSSDVTFVVPKDNRRYLLKPIRFSGSYCKSDITMQIFGTIIASDDRSDYSKDRKHWLVFDRVKNLLVEGDGIIDGNGDIWWKNSCKRNKSQPCKRAPTALSFNKCRNLVVKNVRVQNAQQMHISFHKCRNVEASNVTVNSPKKSPNTDGIHITATQNIIISNATIATGDDCISIVNGSEKIRATDITCGSGHGISIGSLGSGNSEAHVSDVVVNGAKLSGTTNGVRIKTWQGGSGSASNIKFQNIEMENVKNPIIIIQNYCDKKEPCKQQSSAVQIKDVVYKNIKGTSASSVAIKFECSENHPCQGIVLENVSLVGEDDGKVKAVCDNVVKLQNLGRVSPSCP